MVAAVVQDGGILGSDLCWRRITCGEGTRVPVWSDRSSWAPRERSPGPWSRLPSSRRAPAISTRRRGSASPSSAQRSSTGLPHLHASTLGSVLTHEHHPLAALRAELPETAPILGAVVPLVAVLVGVDLLGGDLSTAAWAALWVSIALLVIYSYIAGVRGGLGRVGPHLERHPGRRYRPSRRAAQDPPALTQVLRR